MPVPNTQILLGATVHRGGGHALLSQAPGDLTAIPLGSVGAGSVGSVCNLNGDGVADLILGTPGSNDKTVDVGRVFVTLGASLPERLFDMSHPDPGVFTIDRVKAGDMAGFVVGSLADLDGDGLSEILVGAPAWTWAWPPTRGKVLSFGPGRSAARISGSTWPT